MSDIDPYVGPPTCVRCGCLASFSVFCHDCLGAMTLAEAYHWEVGA